MLLLVYEFSNPLSRDYKYTIGERLKSETLELLLLVFKSSTADDKNKKAFILEAIDKIELVRLLLRVLKELKQLSLKRYAQISVLTENISKQLTGWKKSLKWNNQSFYCQGNKKCVSLNPVVRCLFNSKYKSDYNLLVLPWG